MTACLPSVPSQYVDPLSAWRKYAFFNGKGDVVPVVSKKNQFKIKEIDVHTTGDVAF
jgi:hypothetical protein